MGIGDGLKRMLFFPITVHIFVPRANGMTIITDKAKRIRQADRKEYGLLKTLKKEFTFTADDIFINHKGKRILYLFTKDFLKFVPMKIDNGNEIKPVDMKKLSIYTDNIKRTYEDTENKDKWMAYLPLMSIIIFAIAFVIIGNFSMEQINTITTSAGGVATEVGRVADALGRNCLSQPINPIPV